MSDLWKVQRAIEGGLRYYPAAMLDQIDEYEILGVLAAAEEEYGPDDPASLASVIDWPMLRRRGESHADYWARVARTPPTEPHPATSRNQD